MFHSSVDSFAEVQRGGEAYDNFLPHGLFQKLTCKCSKQGWTWTKDRYQDSISFTTDDVLISLKVRKTWILLDVFSSNSGTAVRYDKYQSIISDSLKELLFHYHPNMWFERGVSPCCYEFDCPLSIGSNSIEDDCPRLHMVTCSDHMHSLATPQFNMWFSKSPSRPLTLKDLKRVGNELTEPWRQLNVALELDIPESEINAINADNSEIKLASFKLLKYWYDQQVYKVEAFVTLCKAPKNSEQSSLVGKCLLEHK